MFHNLTLLPWRFTLDEAAEAARTAEEERLAAEAAEAARKKEEERLAAEAAEAARKKEEERIAAQDGVPGPIFLPGLSDLPGFRTMQGLPK